MAKIKEILCLHHSHLDVGYTHPQDMLLRLQTDYIDQAIDLCVKTAAYPEEAQFRWTCEASLPVERWFETASPDRAALFRRLAREGRISVTALPMHTTPGISAHLLTDTLKRLDALRALTGSAITCAISHDVNGQPWTLAPLLLDAGVEFYMTGINIHFGGIPMPRPCVFRWKTPDGRELPSFVGEHYSLFSQFFFTPDNDTDKMHRGVEEYVERIGRTTDWPYDFAVLTATNPPLYDNNSPDSNLPDLIARYNAEARGYTIRFVTPEMLWERLQAAGADRFAAHGGDWTDYWNFGCGSTAREVKLSRRAGRMLETADFLGAATPHEQAARAAAADYALLFQEHTWGASDSVTDADSESSEAMLLTKKGYAYTAAAEAAYVLGSCMERTAGNTPQNDSAPEGVLLVNPHGFSAVHEVRIPPQDKEAGRAFSAVRTGDYLPYDTERRETCALGWAEVPPYSVMRVPYTALTPDTEAPTLDGDTLETPFYTVELEPHSRRIRQITDKATGRALLDEHSPWRLFDLVEERVKPPLRRSIFPRDVGLGNRNISQWNTAWRAAYSAPNRVVEFHTTSENGNLTLLYTLEANDQEVLQKVTFSRRHRRILFDVMFDKQADTAPHGVYFTIPLALEAGWQAVFDTADTFVRLDDDQLGTVCRDYVTVDKTVSMFDAHGGVTLACPDAPLVQIGGFHFGRELHAVPREQHPLLLAWPMNNYWDTNFAASQGGRAAFHYELSAFAAFSPEQAYEAGVLAGGAVTQGCALDCREAARQQLIRCDSEAAYPIFVCPLADGGRLIAVKNFADAETRVTLTFACPMRTAVTDVRGNPREVPTTGDACALTLPPNALGFVRADNL